MASTFIKSTKIKAFPTSYRNGYDPGAKFFSEENIGNILNSIVDNHSISHKNGFVVGDVGEISDGQHLTFNIRGYWFNIIFNYADFNTFKPAESGDDGSIYAIIQTTVDETPDADNKKLKRSVLKNLDPETAQSDNLDTDEDSPSTSLFTGIRFYNEIPSTSGLNIYYLKIAEWDEDNEAWRIPQNSTLKLSTWDILDKADTAQTTLESAKNINRKFTSDNINVNDRISAANATATINHIEINVKNSRWYIAGYEYILGTKYYTWWIDDNANFYQMNGVEITTIDFASTGDSGIQNAIITGRKVSNNPIYEADWTSNTGKRMYATASTLPGLSSTSGVEYQKTSLSYSNNILTISYNE